MAPSSKGDLKLPPSIRRVPTSAPRLIHNFWLGFAKTFSLLKPTPAAESAQELQVSTPNCYKPWWIAQHLAAPASYSKSSASHGLDNYFVDHAKLTRKEIAGLESVDEHVAVLGGLSDRDGEFMLRDALSQPQDGAKELSKMYKAWRRGDTNALWAGDARLRNQAPRIAARFVDDRNVKWIPRIEAELKTGKPTAIVAGALHFSGPRSVIALLQQRGYQIEQL